MSASRWPAQPALKLAYKVPRITVKDYFGPASLQEPPASSSAGRCVPVRNRTIRRASRRASITAPRPCRRPSLRRCDSGRWRRRLFGLAMQGSRTARSPAQNRRGGRLHGQRTTGRQGREAHRQSCKPSPRMTSDINAIVAVILDPQKVNDDRYYRSYPADLGRPLCRHVGPRPPN